MRSQRSKGYFPNSKPSDEKLLAFIFASIGQCEKLYIDAKDLSKINKNNPTVLNLIILSMEELGKALLILEYLIFEKNKCEKWISLRGKLFSHEEKIKIVLKLTFKIFKIKLNQAEFEELLKFEDKIINHGPSLYKIIKEFCVYTTFANNEVQIPLTYISNNKLENIREYELIIKMYLDFWNEKIQKNFIEIYPEIDNYLNNVKTTFPKNTQRFIKAAKYSFKFINQFSPDFITSALTLLFSGDFGLIALKIDDDKYRRSIRVYFELLNKCDQITSNEDFLENLKDDSLNLKALSIFEIVKKRDLLKN